MSTISKGKKNSVFRLLLYLVIGYSVLLVLAFLLQRRLLYFPDRQIPSDRWLRAAGLRLWPEPGSSCRGLTGTATLGRLKGLIVIFHGNAGAAWNRDYYVHALGPLGYRVVLAEYPGYGSRPGEMNEGTFVADAKETVKRAQEQFGGPVYLWGESLGAGVAAAVAADPPVAIEGVIMMTPWDSLPNLAQNLYWFLPVRYLLRDKYDSVRNLRSFTGPVAVVIAAHDEIIPRKRSTNLFESLSGTKRRWLLENAGHNTWPADPAEPWWNEVMDFVSTGESNDGS
jgi:pimeloyl-ACP methyl ester carboxylesterase